MQDPNLISAAVFNNAVWCDAVCQALGCDTDFVDDLWINSGTSPPFYPNTGASSSRNVSRMPVSPARPAIPSCSSPTGRRGSSWDGNPASRSRKAFIAFESGWTARRVNKGDD